MVTYPLVECFQHGVLDHLQWCRHPCHLGTVLCYLFDRNEKSFFLLSTFARNFCQSPGILAVPDMHCQVSVPCFSLVPPLSVGALYWSQTMSTLVDRFKSWWTLGQNTLSKKVFLWTVVPGSEFINTSPSITVTSVWESTYKVSCSNPCLFVLFLHIKWTSCHWLHNFYLRLGDKISAYRWCKRIQMR